MKRRLVIDVDEEGTITVEGETTGASPENVAVDQSRETARILTAAAKQVRKDCGVLQIVVLKDLKSQSSGIDFQKDEIKDLGEALGMLSQAVRLVEFQQWFAMFMGAQQAMAQQAMAEHQKIQLAAGGNGGGLFKGPRR